MDAARAAVDHFYAEHPVTDPQIEELLARRGRAEGSFRPPELFAIDQDHYGGTSAVDELADLAGIGAGSKVLDLGAGIAGPARYLAFRRRCSVVAVELAPSRCALAADLTRRVGLDASVHVVRGDAAAIPLGDRCIDACVAQESFLHIADKATLFAECHRVLRPGARLAFTDWAAADDLGSADRERAVAAVAAHGLADVDSHAEALLDAGFVSVRVESLSLGWALLLRDRLTRYQSVREETVAREGEERYQRWVQTYSLLLGLLEEGRLRGIRVVAEVVD